MSWGKCCCIRARYLPGVLMAWSGPGGLCSHWLLKLDTRGNNAIFNLKNWCQWFADFGVNRSHLGSCSKSRFLGPTPRDSDSLNETNSLSFSQGPVPSREMDLQVVAEV